MSLQQNRFSTGLSEAGRGVYQCNLRSAFVLRPRGLLSAATSQELIVHVGSPYKRGYHFPTVVYPNENARSLHEPVTMDMLPVV
ncbi:hypothetical protein NPIL_317821 [Nephila pilipes]|uniref:Uncharacterized protein n=1 Tax=Nephila pilipes TaxID=299642 RepID=A0A8X6QMB8_NEPPI|nr:hypothetical protein NPIL_317821 [Nephila pilipes]